MKPYVGAIVYYTLGSGDADAINSRRRDADAFRRKVYAKGLHGVEAGEPGRTGHVAHTGNGAAEGDVYPAVIVRDWNEHSGTVNLQVLLDGNDTYWATSRLPGDGPGTWCWRRPAGLVQQERPYIGAVVHYVSYGTPGGEYKSECRAAIVTEVPGTFASADGVLGPKVGLCVLSPAGQFFDHDVQYHEGNPGHDHTGTEIPARSYHGGSWHWPERA